LLKPAHAVGRFGRLDAEKPPAASLLTSAKVPFPASQIAVPGGLLPLFSNG
jgi:hypothetical protein